MPSRNPPNTKRDCATALVERTVASALAGRRLVSVRPDADVRQAARLMAEAGTGCALVLAEGGIVGILTEQDILAKITAAGLDAAKTAVRWIMIARPVCVRAETSVIHALYTMKELDLQHFPVVGQDHEPLGVFSLRDAFPSELVRAETLSAVKTKITGGGT